MNLNDPDYPVYNSLLQAATRWPAQLAVADEFGSINYRILCEHTELLKNVLLNAGVTPETGIALITNDNRYFIMGL